MSHGPGQTNINRPRTPRSLLDPGAGLVKICGLRQPEHAVAAVAAGADLLGFIFAPARRRVTPEAARQAIEAARNATPSRTFSVVGVFVDADAAEINEVVRVAGLDLVQLNGDEPAELLSQISCPVIKGVLPPLGTPPEQIDALLGKYRAVENAPVLYLIDGYVPGAAGGAGARADWDLARELAVSWPLSLAGGLDAGNVSTAIRAVQPRGVDVSSGVESDGVKDMAKIAGFVTAAKAAFAGLGAVSA